MNELSSEISSPEVADLSQINGPAAEEGIMPEPEINTPQTPIAEHSVPGKYWELKQPRLTPEEVRDEIKANQADSNSGKADGGTSSWFQRVFGKK